ncbi:MAG: aldo/keto reductase [Ktedonobacteraceae bacterium]|nr:aldo/keto reductase [Ktedonobacteraceae bacterium]
METRQFGKTDMQVTVLGLGGSEVRGSSLADVRRLLGNALDVAGINVIDTAECYGDSEDLIGRAVGSRRSDYYLFTKCGHAVGEELPALPDWDPRLLEASIDRSLRRLRTDHVDLLQLHSCSLDVLRRGDVIKVLEKAKHAGKTRYIGYSGNNEDARYAIRTEAFDVLQTTVNIADQQEIDFTLPMAIERNMGIIAKRPLANAAWIYDEVDPSAYHYQYWERLKRLQYGFLQHRSEHSFEIALRFTLSVSGVNTAIVGTANPERPIENARFVSAGPLRPELYQEIRARWEEKADPHWLGLD